jgi:2-octaprenyl-6-methoxyphenol hydroxylase
MTDYDIAIIGGGLAGLSLAAALAPLSLRILMIDSRREPSGKVDDYDERSLALGFGSRLIYSGIGVWDKIATAATPIKTVHVSEQGHLGSTRLSAAESGVGALGYVVTLRHLATVLEHHIASQPNLTRLHQATLTGIETDGEAATLTIENEGKPLTITTRLLVGADGGASASRRLLGIDTRVEPYDQMAVIANITTSKPHEGCAFERFTASGPMALLPLDDNRCALVWSQSPANAERILQRSDEEFMAEIPQHFGFRLGKVIRTGKREAFPLTMTVARSLTRQRSLLLGNAAHALHPIAGQGLNLALRDVAVLAELLAGHDDPGDDELLQIYAQRRLPDINATANTSDGLLRIFMNPWAPLGHARGAALIALNRMTPLKRRLARLGMGFRHNLQGPLFQGEHLR